MRKNSSVITVDEKRRVFYEGKGFKIIEKPGEKPSVSKSAAGIAVKGGAG
jgi:hypothetical protein